MQTYAIIRTPSYADLIPLKQFLKKSFGLTPTEYINTLRLDAAVKELSLHPNKSIVEIALQCGFNDYRYFDRIFKKRYGVTPSVLRKVTVAATASSQ